jgi:rhodanese-related sulfurtransferase
MHMQGKLLCAVALVALAPIASAQEVKTISTAELKAKTDAGPAASWMFALIDARSETEFNEGHIPGAMLVPAKKTADKLPAIAQDKARLVIFYCNGPGCTKSLKGAKLALSAGYTNVREYNEGLPAWQGAGYKVSGTPLPAAALPLVAPSALKGQLGAGGPALVDIRDADEFEKFRIAGSVNIPLDALAKRVKELPPGKICIVDHVGHQASVAARVLAKLGHTDLEGIAGGIMAWQDADLPTTAQK